MSNSPPPFIDHTTRLPTEVLGAIFRHVARDLFIEDWTADLLNEPSPGTLYTSVTSICRRWRIAARSDPALWSLISVRLSLTSLAYLEDHIHCSGATLLNIQILRGTDSIGTDRNLTNAIVARLLSVATRWEAFSTNRAWSMSYSFGSALSESISPPHIHFPNLRHLAFSPCREKQLTLCGATVPLLTTLSLDCSYFHNVGLSLPWEQLRFVWLRGIFEADLPPLLDQLPGLEELHLIQATHCDVIMSTQPISLPRLQTLHVQRRCGPTPQTLALLLAPALQHISIDCWMPEDIFLVNNIVRKSSARLRTATFSGDAFWTQEGHTFHYPFLEFLHLNPYIESLQVNAAGSSTVSVEVLKQLMGSSGDMACPLLISLSLPEASFRINQMSAFIRTRLGSQNACDSVALLHLDLGGGFAYCDYSGITQDPRIHEEEEVNKLIDVLSAFANRSGATLTADMTLVRFRHEEYLKYDRGRKSFKRQTVQVTREMGSEEGVQVISRGDAEERVQVTNGENAGESIQADLRINIPVFIAVGIFLVGILYTLP